MQKKILATFRPEFLPALEYIWYVSQCDVLVLTDHFQFVKRSPVSISAPLSDAGEQLRIPVKHDGKKTPISAKHIDNNHNWHKKHLSRMRHLYHEFPFSFYYFPLIEELYQQADSLLSNFLKRFLQILLKWFHIPAAIVPASDFNPQADNNNFIINLCAKLKCDTYAALPEVYEHNWVNRTVIEKESIQTEIFQSGDKYYLVAVVEVNHSPKNGDPYAKFAIGEIPVRVKI